MTLNHDVINILMLHGSVDQHEKFSHYLNSENVLVEKANHVDEIKKAFESISFDIFICFESVIEEDDEIIVANCLTNAPMTLTCHIGDHDNCFFDFDFFVTSHDVEDTKVCKLLVRNLLHLARKQKFQFELSSMLMHDLRSPTQSIIGYLELLEKDIFGEINDGQRHILSNAISLGDRLVYLMEELSQVHQFERKEFVLTRSRIHLRDFIDEALRTLWIQADKKEIKFVPQVDKNLPDLVADGPALERVLINLITNAIKYSPEKGTVRINVQPSESTSMQQMIRFRISDSGPGVPVDKLNFIFDKYYRIRSDRRLQKGFGLGLYISKLIVEAHGGQIGAYNNREGGSTFYFTIPVKMNSNNNSTHQLKH